MINIFARFRQLSDPEVSDVPYAVNIDKDKCIGCGLCVKQCPTQTLALSEKDAEGRRYVEFVKNCEYFEKICIACHNCEVICPKGALAFPHYYEVKKGYWKTDFDYPDALQNGYPNPFKEKKTPEFATIADKLTETEKVIYQRRSIRIYKDKQVPEKEIHRIIEAGRFAPSAGNGRPWQFIVLRDPSVLAEISEATLKWTTKITKLYQGKNFWRQVLKNSMALFKPAAIDQRPMVAMQALATPAFQDEPLDVFFGAKTCILVLRNSLGISNPDFDAGICSQNMVLAAHSMGLGTCYVGFVSTGMKMDGALKRIKKRLGVRWPYDIATAITVGYPAARIDGVVKREFPKVEWFE